MKVIAIASLIQYTLAQSSTDSGAFKPNAAGSVADYDSCMKTVDCSTSTFQCC